MINKHSYAYRIVGRIALITAFVLAIGNELRGAVALLAVALWMMWFSQNLLIGVVGNDVESLAKSQEEAFEDIKGDLEEIRGRTESLGENY